MNAMTVIEAQTCEAKTFNLSGLDGISDKTLEIHLELYEGYVDQTNLLMEQLSEMVVRHTASAADSTYAALKRHLGFEYGGMILHEFYFGNLAPKGRDNPSKKLLEALERWFGDFESWKSDFAAVGSMRGIGWAVLNEDPYTGILSNHWIELHHQGVPPGFKPILAMDVWEHSYLLDYKPSERKKYIDAFFANIDWSAVNARLLTPTNIARA